MEYPCELFATHDLSINGDSDGIIGCKTSSVDGGGSYFESVGIMVTTLHQVLVVKVWTTALL